MLQLGEHSNRVSRLVQQPNRSLYVTICNRKIHFWGLGLSVPVTPVPFKCCLINTTLHRKYCELVGLPLGEQDHPVWYLPVELHSGHFRYFRKQL